MSDDLRVIRAVFASWRPVQGRSVVQLIMEVPIEHTHDVMTRLGVPMPGESKWVAIALLKEDSALLRNEAEKAPEDAPISSGAGPKERKPFNTLPLSQQCAIRCQDKSFIEFMDGFSNLAGSADTAWAVRHYCEVDSRSKIVEGTLAGAMWLDLEKRYQAWLTDQRYSEARR